MSSARVLMNKELKNAEDNVILNRLVINCYLIKSQVFIWYLELVIS